MALARVILIVILIRNTKTIETITNIRIKL